MLTDAQLTALRIFENSSLPDIYFHATNQTFSEFCLSKKGENTNHSNTDQGFFFTNAQGLERIKHDNPNTFGEITLRVRLNVKKPLRLTNTSIFTELEQASLIWESVSTEKETNAVALAQLNENIGLGEIAELHDHFNSGEFLTLARAGGYDGIISEMGDREIQFIAFEPAQIQILTPEAILNAYQSGMNKLLVRSINEVLTIKHKRGIKL